MAVKGQRKIAPVLALFWAMAMVTVHFLYEDIWTEPVLIGVLFSLFFLAVGLIISSGRGRSLLFLTFFPFIMSEEDLSRYDEEKVSLAMGSVYVFISCALLFIFVSTFVFWATVGIIVAVYYVAAVLILVSKRFRSDTRPKY